MPTSAAPRAPRERPVVGVVAGWQTYEGTTPNWFLEALFQGVMEAGRTLGCDLLLACGVGPGIGDPRAVRPAWPEVLGDGDFVPVGAWNTDGLIFISPLRTAERRDCVRRLQEEGHPVVFVGDGDGRPAVLADSVPGIRQALVHLREHGHRDVVYVAGDPQDPGDSRVRLEAFHAVAGELGLDHDDSRTEPGYHSEPGGYEAMQRLLERGLRFSAVLASNDNSALGAMRALAESGRRAPDDVAVVGFDDQPWAAGHIPPLTTIRYPLVEAGWKAVDLLLSGIRGGAAPAGVVRVPTRLVGRRSCGCLPREGALGREGRGSGGGTAPEAPASGPRGTVRAMVEALDCAGSSLAAGEVERLCGTLFAGFETSLAGGGPAAFEGSLLGLLQTLEEEGEPAHLWQTALSILRSELLALEGAGSLAEWAEDLVHLGRVVLSESAERQGGRQRLLDSAYEGWVSELTVRLHSVHEESELLEILTVHAPALGMRPTYLALYEAVAEDPVAFCRTLLPRAKEGPDREATASERGHEPRALSFDRFFSAEAPGCLAVLPLIHKGQSPGFVAFSTETLAPCAAVARQLAVALESVRLQEKVRALTLRDDLTGLYNRRFFEAELTQEIERSRRFRHDVALVMLDLDHFKAYNDSFGHRAGDDALRQVAARIASCTHRRLDAIVRYGGEEFAILLAQTDLEGARQVAERFREAIEDCTEFLRPLTVSAGVAAQHGRDCDAERLVLESDRALYQAKEEGRNRVCVAASVSSS